jgi:hypothetical protein
MAGLENREYGLGICCADQETPFYPQKLSLTSQISGGRSVGLICLRTKATANGAACGSESLPPIGCRWVVTWKERRKTAPWLNWNYSILFQNFPGLSA